MADSRAILKLLQRPGIHAAFACAIIAGYAWFRYHDCLVGYFYLDDYWLIEAAAGIKLGSPWDLAALLEPTHTGFKLYRPLTQVGYFYLLRSLFAYDATPYHAFQLLVFIANGILVYAVVRRLAQSALAGLAAAMLYMAAPGHASGVYWLAAFTMTGTTLVVLTSMWWWLRTQSNWRPVGCVILQAVALLASEHGVVIPLLLLSLALFSAAHEPWRRVAWHMAPSIGLWAAYLVAKLYFWASGQMEMGEYYAMSLDPVGLLVRIGMYAAASFQGLAYAAVNDLSRACIGAGVVGLAAFAAWRAWKNGPHWQLLALGCAIFLIGLSPILLLKNHTFDYFVGIAAMGAALAAIGSCRVASRHFRAVAVGLAIAIVGLDAAVGAQPLQANKHVERVVRGSYRAASWLRAIEEAGSGDASVKEILVPAVPATVLFARYGGAGRLVTMRKARILNYKTRIPPEPRPGQVVLAEARSLAAGDRLPGWDRRWNWLRRAAGYPTREGG